MQDLVESVALEILIPDMREISILHYGNCHI